MSKKVDEKGKDFLSNDFNAEIVLKLPDNEIELPAPNAKLFNNLDEYALKSFPSKKPSRSSSKLQTELDILRKQTEIKERLKEKIQSLDSKKNRRLDRPLPKTISNFMNDNDLGLKNCLNKRVRIFLRRRRKSKHPCEQYACLFGQLMFFDRHWNLILSDVNETMQFVNEELNEELNETLNDKLVVGDKQLSNESNSMSTSLISSIDNRRLIIGFNLENSIKISIRERHFTRLFIRGDNIIYISKV